MQKIYDIIASELKGCMDSFYRMYLAHFVPETRSVPCLQACFCLNKCYHIVFIYVYCKSFTM